MEWNKHKKALLLIFAIALGIRLWFLVQLQTDPVFWMPVSDPKEFNYWAFQIMHRQWLWPQLQNHTPLYEYFIAVIYKIFGFHVNAVAAIQCVLGAASACLMYVLVLRLADPLAALICAGLMSVYWFFIYTQVYLFSESLAMFLNISLLYCLTFAKDSVWKFLSCGILFGLSLICRPEIMPFILIIFWWILQQTRNRKWGCVYYGLYIVGVMAILTPVLMRNYQISGEWVLRTQVGANLYAGNNPDYQGTNIFIERGYPWQDFMLMPYRELNRRHNLTENDKNNFYIHKTWEIIKEHPQQWAALIGGKIFSIVTGREFLRAEDVYFRDLYVRQTPVILFSTRLIFILAMTGLIFSWHERRKFYLIYAFLLSAGGIFIFPAKTRYLVPLIPFVMIFSSLTVSYVYRAIKEGRVFDRIKIYGIILLLTVLSCINPLALPEPDASETYFATASNLQYLKNYELAEQYYKKTLAINPWNSSAEHELGVLYVSTGDYNQALACFSHAGRIDPRHASEEKQAFVETTAMIKQGQSTSSTDTFNDRYLEKYLEYFRYPQ